MKKGFFFDRSDDTPVLCGRNGYRWYYTSRWVTAMFIHYRAPKEPLPPRGRQDQDGTLHVYSHTGGYVSSHTRVGYHIKKVVKNKDYLHSRENPCKYMTLPLSDEDCRKFSKAHLTKSEWLHWFCIGMWEYITDRLMTYLSHKI